MSPQTSHWRAAAAPIIRRTLAHTRGFPWRERRRALIHAYPFGERKGWPYKVWCCEVRHQLADELRLLGSLGPDVDPPWYAPIDELRLSA